MYYDKSLFSSAKEGFALGKEHFYIKNNSQSLISIPFIEIYQMSKNDNEIVIETIDNEIYFVNFEVNNQDIGEEIVKCIYEYIRGMQILEDKDNQNVKSQHDRNHPSGFCPTFTHTGYRNAKQPVSRDRKHHHQHKPWLSPRVKAETRDQKKDVLKISVPAKRSVIKHQNARQKYHNKNQ